MKKIAVLLVTLLILASCNTEQGTNNNSQINNTTEVLDTTTKKEEKLQITTSIIPLASITNYIGGEYIEAKSLVPAGVSPHGFDLKPNQMVDIQNSKLIISLGYDHIDGFLDKALESKNVLVATNGIEMMEGSDDDHHDHEDEHKEDHHDEEEHDEHEWHDEDEHKEDHHDEDEHHEEEGHELDPHVWTSAENALIIAKSIQSRLSELQPQNTDHFAQNYVKFEKELLSVKQNFLDTVKGKKQSEFVVFHDAYNYLLHELNVDDSKKIVFRTNVLSDPNSAEMKEMIDEITNHGVKNFYKEPQFSDSNLDKLASEYNLEVDVFNPLGSDNSKNGYIDNYKNNLKALQKIYE